MLFRPPFGFLTAASARAAAEAGFRIVEWTVSVEDWRSGRTPTDVAEAIVARARAGDVILLHDGNGTHQRSHERCRDRPNAAAAVRLFVPTLAARGLHAAPLADVLGLDLSGDVDLSAGAH
jgi:peptidoglycan/xylan/chitin deacetylase (PgdA/CDA1 family)